MNVRVIGSNGSTMPRCTPHFIGDTASAETWLLICRSLALMRCDMRMSCSIADRSSWKERRGLKQAHLSGLEAAVENPAELRASGSPRAGRGASSSAPDPEVEKFPTDAACGIPSSVGGVAYTNCSKGLTGRAGDESGAAAGSAFDSLLEVLGALASMPPMLLAV